MIFAVLTDFQFSMPNYLKDLPNWNISDHVKLPSHTWCRKEQDICEFDVDLSEMRTESLPIHLELEGQFHNIFSH